MSRNSPKHNKRNLDQSSKSSTPAANGVHPPQTPGGYGAYVVKSTSTNGHGPVVSDTSEGIAATRRLQKQKTIPAHMHNSEYYIKEIIKRLEKIYSLTGTRPSLIFDDWLSIVEATLTTLPDQVKAVGATGWFAEDPPEVKAVFEMVRARYQNSYNSEGATAVWECFGEAFSLLLESSEELSLWGRGSDEPGYSGPDILGAIYLKYASYDPSWAAQYFTPWNVEAKFPPGLRGVRYPVEPVKYHTYSIYGFVKIRASYPSDFNPFRLTLLPLTSQVVSKFGRERKTIRLAFRISLFSSRWASSWEVYGPM